VGDNDFADMITLLGLMPAWPRGEWLDAFIHAMNLRTDRGRCPLSVVKRCYRWQRRQLFGTGQTCQEHVPDPASFICSKDAAAGMRR
jgi:hypothetical protein